MSGCDEDVGHPRAKKGQGSSQGCYSDVPILFKKICVFSLTIAGCDD